MARQRGRGMECRSEMESPAEVTLVIDDHDISKIYNISNDAILII